ncbi:MAG TPA: hypothetical protein VGX28_04680 [Frankiaceae bacterium]|nr:hypothetical protein [Frankiaceae bacterium]
MTADLAGLLDEAFDGFVLRHGFTASARDYEVLVEVDHEQRTYVFRHCVEARVSSALPPASWATAVAGEEGGYLWVDYQVAYPGFSVVSPSEAALRWSEAVGAAFTEVRVETNVHVLSLVFASLDVVR